MTGDVITAGDVDYFKYSLTAGQAIAIELRAVRLDQTAWDGAGNVPRLTLYGTDGTTKIREHDFSGNFSDGWSWGGEDLDMPLYIAPAAGTYYVAVTQDNQTLTGGKYALLVKNVTVTNLQEEAEPAGTSGVNDTPATAQAITPGVIHGFHVSDEDDYYSFTTTGITKVHFDLTAYQDGVSNGDTQYYDSFMYLYDQDGTTILQQDDDCHYYDSCIEEAIVTPGRYYVDVYQYATPPGGPNGEYYLTYTSTVVTPVSEHEPNDTPQTANVVAYGGSIGGDIDVGLVDYYKFTGAKGDMVRVQQFDKQNLQNAVGAVSITLLDTDGTTALPASVPAELQVITTILQASGTYYIKVEPDPVTPVATSYGIQLTKFKGSISEHEANDTQQTANLLSSRILGVIDPAGDEDFLKTTLEANKVATIVAYAKPSPGADGDYNYSGHGSDCWPDLEILDGQGTVVASSTVDAGTAYAESVTDALPTLAVCYIPTTTGTYYVHVVDDVGGGGPTFYYVIEKR
jgi:hypothetical protein